MSQPEQPQPESTEDREAALQRLTMDYPVDLTLPAATEEPKATTND